jgi:hypothetical protein
MAQDLDPVAETLITEAAIHFRNNSITPNLVSKDLSDEAAQKNKVIQVPTWHALAVQDVTPGRGNENTPTDLEPGVINVTLDNWKEVRFNLSDKERAEVIESRVLPETVRRGIEALADTVDLFCLTKMYKRAYEYRVATEPAAVGDLTMLQRLMHENNVPRDKYRRLMLDAQAEEEMVRLAVFHAANQGATGVETQVEGYLGRKFGFDTYGNNQMPSHTPGTLADLLVDTAAAAIGDKTITCDSANGGTALEGDIVTFAGHTQTYVVTADLTLAATASGTLAIEPGLVAAPAEDAAVTFKATHEIAGLGFHVSAFAFASRPLMDFDHPAVVMTSATDPISGISLRITQEWVNKSVEWSIDILYGGEVIIPDGLARMARE